MIKMLVKANFKNQSGYMLIGIAAVAVLISSLLISAVWFSKSAKYSAEIIDQKSSLKKAENALKVFIILNGRLPCPAAERGGNESCGEKINKQKGWLPISKLLQLNLITDYDSTVLANIRYLVYRGNEESSPGQVDMSIIKDNYKQKWIVKSPTVFSTTTNVVSLQDTCAKLNSPVWSTYIPALASTKLLPADKASQNIAFALVATKNEFSEINANDNPEVESPARLQNENYQDIVKIYSNTFLSDYLECQTFSASMNTMLMSSSWTQANLSSYANDFSTYDFLANQFEPFVLSATTISAFGRNFRAVKNYLSESSLSLGRIFADGLKCTAWIIFLGNGCLTLATEPNLLLEKNLISFQQITWAVISLVEMGVEADNQNSFNKWFDKLKNFVNWDQRKDFFTLVDQLGSGDILEGN